jgi:hypothetical protein
MALLDDLMAAYQNAGQQLNPAQLGPLISQALSSGNGSIGSNLTNALNAPQSDSVTPSTGGGLAAMPISQGTGSPMGFGSASAMPQQASSGIDPNPQVVPISDAEAARAQAQQAPAQAASMPTQQVDPGNVATVNTDSSFPSSSDYNADGSQASSSGGGLLASLAGNAQQAASDPVQAKGLLSSLGDLASNIGGKLKSLSPAASQSLIAAGVTMLANNNGTQNLTQLLGGGAAAGLNDYQTITQNQILNRIAIQKNLQDLQEHQATNATANYNAGTERLKALNTPVGINPGDAITTVGQQASGQAPTLAGGPNGTLPIKQYIDVPDGNGNVNQQGVDMYGRPVGPVQPKTLAYTGPLTPELQKTVNDSEAQANKSAQALNRTQSFLSMVTPTMPDPNNPGQTIPNPNYIPVTGGLGATVQNELNKLTGGQTQSQQLRQEIQQNVYMAQLGNWKAGVGGRLSNNDINLLNKGMPPDNASGQALQQYLTAYSHLQEDQATRDRYTADYTAANRGDLGPLHSPQTIQGKQYPAGTQMAAVLSGNAPVQSSQANPSAQQAQALVSQAQQAARNGDTSAQAALKARGLSW